jgi:hypothetical protein
VEQQGRDDDLEQISARLADRRADWQRRIVVGQEVAHEQTRPEGVSAEVEEGDADAHGQPHDRGDGARELERVAELGSPVVGGRKHEPSDQKRQMTMESANRAPRRRGRQTIGSDGSGHTRSGEPEATGRSHAFTVRASPSRGKRQRRAPGAYACARRGAA